MFGFLLVFYKCQEVGLKNCIKANLDMLNSNDQYMINTNNKKFKLIVTWAYKYGRRPLWS